MPPSPMINRLLHAVPPHAPGRASGTLRKALRMALVGSLTVWHLATGLSALVTPDAIDHAPVTLAIHLTLAAAAVAAAAGRFSVMLLATGTWGVYVWTWHTIDHVNLPVFFGTVWLATITTAAIAFLVPGRRGFLVPLAAVAVVPPVMVLLAPDRPWHGIPLSFFVTELAVLVICRIGISYLWEFAHEADMLTERAEREQEQLALAQDASRAAAEGARVLHDTLVNTLAAIASGGAAVRDVEQVRSRCRSDVEAATLLLAGAEDVSRSWEEEISAAALTQSVTHTGLTPAAIDEHLTELAPRTAQALRRATAELVRNAAKHAAASRVTIDVTRHGDTFTVTVADDGRGFDGVAIPGRGLAESVFARADEAGFHAQIASAPNAGTLAVLTHTSPREEVEETTDAVRVLTGIRRRAALLWAGGLTVAGLAVTLVNHPGQANPAFVAVALDAVAFGVVLRVCRNGRRMPPWCAALMLVLVVGTFLSAAAGVGYGHDEPVTWQALAVTGPLLLLLGFSGHRAFTTGLGVAAVLTAGVVATQVQHSAEAATVALMAGLFGIGFSIGWYVFHVALGRIGRRATRDQECAHRARVAAIRTRAGEEGRKRWRDAGLHSSVELLSAIVAGTPPTDAGVRAAAAREERHLRELIRLDPSLTHAGRWLARALSRAHDREVDVVVRTGGSDLPEDIADDVGGVLLRAVELVPPGEQLVITLFNTPAGVRISLVARAPHLAGLLSAGTSTTNPHPWVHQVHGEQEILELVVPHSEVIEVNAS